MPIKLTWQVYLASPPPGQQWAGYGESPRAALEDLKARITEQATVAMEGASRLAAVNATVRGEIEALDAAAE